MKGHESSKPLDCAFRLGKNFGEDTLDQILKKLMSDLTKQNAAANMEHNVMQAQYIL